MVEKRVFKMFMVITTMKIMLATMDQNKLQVCSSIKTLEIGVVLFLFEGIIFS